MQKAHPVKTSWDANYESRTCPSTTYEHPTQNTKRTRVKRHQPVRFSCRDSLRPRSPENSWWSWRRELNPRPSDYKSDALPAELRQRRSNRVRIAEEVLELQEVALKYRARGWPALWKIASALDHLDTRYLPYPLYFSIGSSQPLRSEFNRRR